MEWTVEIISLVVAAFSAFASAIAAIFGVASYCIAKRSEKGYIRRQIEIRRKKIHQIEDQMRRKYGLNYSTRGQIKPEQYKIDKLQSEITEWEERL